MCLCHKIALCPTVFHPCYTLPGMEDNLFKLKFKQQGSDVVVSWDQINLRKQSAFIRGYVLYCEANNKIINNVSTGIVTLGYFLINYVMYHIYSLSYLLNLIAYANK